MARKRTRPFYAEVIHVEDNNYYSDQNKVMCGAAIHDLEYRIGVETDFDGFLYLHTFDVNAANAMNKKDSRKANQCQECLVEFFVNRDGLSHYGKK